jgi:hypothetical protein
MTQATAPTTDELLLETNPEHRPAPADDDDDDVLYDPEDDLLPPPKPVGTVSPTVTTLVARG